MKIRLHTTVQAAMRGYDSATPQALLLVGQSGVGLLTLAEHIASTSGTLLLRLLPEAKTSTARPQISVTQVRELYSQTKANFRSPHFVIIDDADMMNQSAQNALLKLLEEPNPSIRFILTSHSPDMLLPTIRSRMQTLVVPAISTIESNRLLTELGVTDERTKRQLLYIADGLPAALTRLSHHPAALTRLAEQVNLARLFIEGDTYARLSVIQQLKDDRAGTLQLIDMIVLIIRKTINDTTTKSTLALVDNLLEASDLIRANGNIRLQLTNAVL